MSRLLSKLLNKNFYLDKDLALQVSQCGGGFVRVLQLSSRNQGLTNTDTFPLEVP